MKRDICFLCDKKKLCICNDVGGKIDTDNKASVCLGCWIKDKLFRFSIDDLCLRELEKEIISDIELDFKQNKEVLK